MLIVFILEVRVKNCFGTTGDCPQLDTMCLLIYGFAVNIELVAVEIDIAV